MRRTLMIITVALVLCLCGCSEVPRVSDIPTEPSQSESLSITDSEEISQETDAPQSSVDIDTPEESGIASETMVPDVKETESTPQPKEEIKQTTPKEETRATGDSVTTSSFEPVIDGFRYAACSENCVELTVMAQSYPVFQYILYNGSSMFFGLILNIRNIIFNTLDIVSFAVKMSYHSNLTGIHIFIVHLAFYRVRNRFFLSLCFRLFQCDNLSHIFTLHRQPSKSRTTSNCCPHILPYILLSPQKDKPF